MGSPSGPQSPSLERSASTVSSLHFEEPEELEGSQSTIYGHGSYQRMTLFCCVLSLVVLECHGLAFTVIARGVDFWCKRPAAFQQITVTEWKNVALPLESDGSYSRCNVYDHPFGPNKTSMPCSAWEYESSYRTIISTWDLVCSREWLLWYAAVTYLIGAAIAVPFTGMAADQIGRRPVACIAIAVIQIAGLGTCFTSNFTLFVCARCVVAGCSSTIFVTIFVLLLEITSAEHRMLYCITSASLGVGIASIVLVVLQEFTIPWRAHQAVFMALTVLLVTAFYMISESPRWLLATCNFRSAERAILWAAKMNNIRHEMVRTRYSKLKMEILKKEDSLRVTPIYLFTSPLLRVRCSLLFFTWFGTAFSFYALKMTTVVQEKWWASIASAAVPSPLIAIAYLAINRGGLKITLVATFGFLVCCGAVLVARYSSRLLNLTNAVVVVARGATYIALTANHIYTAELFPTILRSLGVCTAYSFGGVGGATAIALTASQDIISPHMTMALLTVLMSFAVLALLPLPRSHSQPLLNTMKDLERLDCRRYFQETLPEHFCRTSPRRLWSLESSHASRTTTRARSAESIEQFQPSLSISRTSNSRFESVARLPVGGNPSTSRRHSAPRLNKRPGPSRERCLSV
ncbi:solute carrier family 22 member 7-like [Ornithodoros turicata]|uniref:solute carrier family 22 member 7-like n=1 Tax=Ornithodoros turicata TaxID=34597 RepID=UPI003138EC1C